VTERSGARVIGPHPSDTNQTNNANDTNSLDADLEIFGLIRVVQKLNCRNTADASAVRFVLFGLIRVLQVGAWLGGVREGNEPRFAIAATNVSGV